MKTLQRLNEHEIPLCLLFNRVNRYRLINRFFAVISRLGDGVFWYTLIAMLPFIYGMGALTVSLHMLLTAGMVLLVYKWLKTNTQRIRPYRYNSHILQSVTPLDQFSFPSGHTMHAVSFSYVLLYYYPEWFWLVVPFTALVALSRVVLGLHYPSDVIVGGSLGACAAGLPFWAM